MYISNAFCTFANDSTKFVFPSLYCSVMAKKQKANKPVYTTIRVTSDANRRFAKAVDKYNDRHPDNTLNKTEYFSLLLDYCHQFGIDVDDTEKPLTEMRKLRSSVKSLNDSAWAAKRETEKFVQEQNAKANKVIASEQEVCATLAEMIADKDFNNEVLKPIRERLDGICQNWMFQRKDKAGDVKDYTLGNALADILSVSDVIRQIVCDHSKDPKTPTLLDRIIHIEEMLQHAKEKKRFLGI